MKVLDIGTQEFTVVNVLDAPGAGGACHEYEVCNKDGIRFAEVHFQNGSVKENGVNGCHQEDLLAIVIHRLQSFQSGPYACRENDLALTKIQEALHWLRHRTDSRKQRGVEGTSVV